MSGEPSRFTAWTVTVARPVAAPGMTLALPPLSANAAGWPCSTVTACSSQDSSWVIVAWSAVWPGPPTGGLAGGSTGGADSCSMLTTLPGVSSGKRAGQDPDVQRSLSKLDFGELRADVHPAARAQQRNA